MRDVNLNIDIEKLRKKLNESGFEYETNQLNDAVISGYTTTEILGNILLVLNGFKKKRVIMNLFDNDINDLIKRIKKLTGF